MKKITFNVLILMLAAVVFTACEKEKPVVKPQPEEQTAGHFDIWSSVGAVGGMSDGNGLIKSVQSLDEGVLDYKNSGVSITQDILLKECFVKGKYYYTVTKNGRFGKYRVTDKVVETVKEFPFDLLKDRRFCHLWLDDKTAMLIGSNGPSSKILWAKIDTEQMQLLDSGELKLPEPKEGETFNSSGMAAYRKADNKIIYSFVYLKNRRAARGEFYMAFIDAANPSAEPKIVTENRAEQMASTAFGELTQPKSFFDEQGNYYIACAIYLPNEGASTTSQRGVLLRVKNGETQIDPSYNGYSRERGKFVGMAYMGNNKALLYMQDPMYTTGNTTWLNNNYIFYYLFLDLNTGAITDLKEQLPFTSGNFADRFLVRNGKAYIGVNPEKSDACVYVYDIAKNTFAKGMSIASGYAFERIAWIED